MAFVDRDQAGKIVAANFTQQRPGQELVRDDDDALVAFLNPAPDYAAQRRAAYPPVGDQFDALQAAVAALAAGQPVPADAKAVIDAVAAVKVRFPKPVAVPEAAKPE